MMLQTTIIMNDAQSNIEAVKIPVSKDGYLIPSFIKIHLGESYTNATGYDPFIIDMQQNITGENSVIRKMIPIEMIVTYWETVLIGLTLEQAEATIIKRIAESQKEITDIDGYENYISKKQKVFHDNHLSFDSEDLQLAQLKTNLNKLVSLESIIPSNLFYADSFVVPTDNTLYFLDIGNDDKSKQCWGLEQKKIDAANDRFQKILSVLDVKKPQKTATHAQQIDIKGNNSDKSDATLLSAQGIFESEKQVNPEMAKNLITQCPADLESFYKTLRQLSHVKSATTQQSYTPETIIEICGKVLNKEVSIDCLTQTYGIRSKFISILISTCPEDKESFYNVLKLCSNNIKGNQKTYTPDELIGICKRVANKELSLDYLTKSFGIREKFGLILAKENEATLTFS